MGKLLFGKIIFNEEQTKAINEMIPVWKEIGKKELYEDIIEIIDDKNLIKIIKKKL